MLPKVLVIEDNADLRLLLKVFLKRGGYDVVSLPSAEEALVEIKAGLVPCLILIDMNLHEMGGAEFVQTLKKDHSEFLAKTPVVIMSGEEPKLIDQVSGFLQKPVSQELLLQTVDAHCKPSAAP